MREERDARLQMEASMTPGAILAAGDRLEMEAVKPQGSFFRQSFRSQWGSKQGRDHIAASTDETTANPRFSNRQTRWLRSLDFGFIRNRYTAIQGNAPLQKRANLFFFMFPVVISVGVGMMHMASQSFLIYLKYQALVDQYYYQEIVGKE